jgi:alcohol dehydrogenase class IV
MHALAHPIGALYDTHHGMTNATLMPYVLKFNRPAIEERITRLAAYLRLPSPGFDSFLAFVLKLRKDIAVPHTLFELGVDDRQADLIADMAIVDPSAGGNPLPLTRTGAAEIFEAAFHGRL